MRLLRQRDLLLWVFELSVKGVELEISQESRCLFFSSVLFLLLGTYSFFFSALLAKLIGSAYMHL